MNFKFDPQAYGPVISELLSVERVPPLGPGQPDAAARSKLQAADTRKLFAHTAIRAAMMAEACRAALWLYYDYLDESHRISQDIGSTTGSYWHGIMHRREPDYMNAKYWFRRVPRHPVFEELGDTARALFRTHAETDPHAEFLEHVQPWDPLAFVDLCEAIAKGKAHCEALARDVAMAEWRLLFTHCYEGAIA